MQHGVLLWKLHLKLHSSFIEFASACICFAKDNNQGVTNDITKEKQFCKSTDAKNTFYININNTDAAIFFIIILNFLNKFLVMNSL